MRLPNQSPGAIRTNLGLQNGEYVLPSSPRSSTACGVCADNYRGDFYESCTAGGSIMCLKLNNGVAYENALRSAKSYCQNKFSGQNSVTCIEGAQRCDSSC
jgi:hypothetical protein